MTLTPEQLAKQQEVMNAAKAIVTLATKKLDEPTKKWATPALLSIAYTAESTGRTISGKSLGALVEKSKEQVDPANFLKDFAKFYKTNDIRTPLTKQDKLLEKYSEFKSERDAKQAEIAQQTAANAERRAANKLAQAERSAQAQAKVAARVEKLTPAQQEQRKRSQEVAALAAEVLDRVDGKIDPKKQAEVIKFAHANKGITVDDLEKQYRAGTAKVLPKVPKAPQAEVQDR